MITKPIILIAAIDQNRGLGKNGVLAHSLKKDMQFFKQETSSTSSPGLQNAVIMGRKTWESIPKKFRPLPNRTNYILSTQNLNIPNVCHSLEDAIQKSNHNPLIEKIYIIGGSQIYNYCLQNNIPDKIILTQIQHDLQCDVFLNQLPNQYQQVSQSELFTENSMNFTFQTYQKHKNIKPSESKDFNL